MPPFEIFTFLGTMAVGIVTKILAAKQRNAHELELAKLRAMGAELESVEKARAVENVGVQWTRRTIALLITFFVVVWPKIVVVFWPEVNVIVGYTEIVNGLWPFISDSEVTRWKSISGGLALTPLDSYLLYGVAGFYLGKGKV